MGMTRDELRTRFNLPVSNAKNTKPYKVVFYEDKAGEHRWKIKAGNNRIVADSGEGYSTYIKVVEAWWRIAGIMDAGENKGWVFE